MCMRVCVCVSNLNNRIIIFNISFNSMLWDIELFMLSYNIRNILSISYYDFHALRFHNHQI